MSDARQSTRAAVDAGADRYFPTIMRNVNAQLAEAERQLAMVDYRGAEQQALAAKSEALWVRGMVLALTSSVEIVAQAERITKLELNAHSTLRQALNAALQGDEAVAMVLAEQARREADLALENHDLEQAQILATNLHGQTQHLQSTALREALESAEEAIQQHEGHRAYSLLVPYAPPP